MWRGGHWRGGRDETSKGGAQAENPEPEHARGGLATSEWRRWPREIPNGNAEDDLHLTFVNKLIPTGMHAHHSHQRASPRLFLF